MRRLETMRRRSESRYSLTQWGRDVAEAFSFSGNKYLASGLQTSLKPVSAEAIPEDFGGMIAAAKRTPPMFAAQVKRARVMGGTRFVWQANPGTDEPGRLIGNADLELLERPWPKGTTRDLVTRMEWHGGLAGNAFVFRSLVRDRLRLLNPAWVTIVYASESDPDGASWATDGELAGYVYTNGGLLGGGKTEILGPDDVAHWAPIPDPLSPERGMSWATPILREVQTDELATTHTARYFENGATPNLVVKGITAPDGQELSPALFDEIVSMLEGQHKGVANAWKTLYLTPGADATVVGSSLKDADVSEIQGKIENRIAVASEVPAVILSLSEGHQGSGLQQGFAQAAKRIFADTWYTPQAESLASALEVLVPAQRYDVHLSTDPRANTFLQEDRKDEAEIQQGMIAAIRTAIDAGFDPDSAVAAVVNGDLKALTGTHTGLTSVQLVPAATAQDDPKGSPQ